MVSSFVSFLIFLLVGIVFILFFLKVLFFLINFVMLNVLLNRGLDLLFLVGSFNGGRVG